MEFITVFFGSLLTVYMLGINSQLVRDKNCIGAFSLAWFISLSNMLYIKVFVLSDDFMLTYLCSALGSGIGIVLSIITYTKVHTLLTRNHNNNSDSIVARCKGRKNA
ncbi:hypothetical protein SAMN05216262_102280 [Colwellia chukchiensis]|uniref:Uncharacterized protein n=1 Tax=Colwellia chukchiensis TaxID=641665 RepID=A0A1H7JLD4_9GAMM|nr:hypothetical protein [Colwellia chukchiensis]SEK75439.1 hypothetical protein SAMN05216262_102280 [Colwellia chukchiensis]